MSSRFQCLGPCSRTSFLKVKILNKKKNRAASVKGVPGEMRSHHPERSVSSREQVTLCVSTLIEGSRNPPRYDMRAQASYSIFGGLRKKKLCFTGLWLCYVHSATLITTLVTSSHLHTDNILKLVQLFITIPSDCPWYQKGQGAEVHM